MEEEEEGRDGEDRGRERVAELARTSALPPRDVVKYVAIYTGDWRHWRLGSERVPYPLLRCYPPVPNPFIPLCRPLNPVRAGVACRIKKAFAKSRCLPERCKIEAMRSPLAHHLLIPQTFSTG